MARKIGKMKDESKPPTKHPMITPIPAIEQFIGLDISMNPLILAFIFFLY
jgi:hypothetical protein